MCIGGLLTSCIKMPLYTSLQAFKGFNKVHNSHSINNNHPSTYKLLTCILLVQSSYTNMAFSSHLQTGNNQGTFNDSIIFSIHLQAKNNQGILKHSMVINIHLLASSTTPIHNYSSRHPVGSLPEKDKVYLEISETVSIEDNVCLHCTDQRIA